MTDVRLSDVRTIWKINIPIEAPDPTEAPLPRAARFVSCGITAQTPTAHISVWAEVAPAMPISQYHLRVIGTGHPIAPNEHYVGTVIDPDLEPLVWHVVQSWEGNRSMTARMAFLPRLKYRVTAEADGWGVYAADDHGAFT
jgi:hypothetical protein